MQKHIKTKYVDQQAVFAFAKYQADGSTAITLHDKDSGERLAVATTCLMDYGLKPVDERHIFVKSYSENEGMAEALFKAGVISEPKHRYEVGPYGVPVYECKLSDEAFAERQRQFAERGEL